MNPHLPGVGETTVHKDAIIFAGHKFIGGVQSPGVLVTKRSLLKDKIATEDMRDSHHYHRDAELREESGTAGVVEAIRCGLAVQLKENVTPRAIVARQDKISRYHSSKTSLVTLFWPFFLLVRNIDRSPIPVCRLSSTDVVGNIYIYIYIEMRIIINSASIDIGRREELVERRIKIAYRIDEPTLPVPPPSIGKCWHTYARSRN